MIWSAFCFSVRITSLLGSKHSGHAAACCIITVLVSAATKSLRVPKVISWGDTSQGSYLVTEHLNFGGRADHAAMGRQLARMHKATPKVLSYPQRCPQVENFVQLSSRVS